MKKTPWTAAQIPLQTGRRALVTGANSGLGWHTALELARRGAEVILAARSAAKAEDAAARIRQEVPEARLLPGVLDLADLASVRRFAAAFSGEPLDLLIHNAAVMAVPRRELTVDGFERQFGTNYLGPFALTALLFPALRRQPGTRVVTVCSMANKQARIEFDNLQSERLYKPMFQAYAQSKLANTLFAVELQRRLSAAGSPIVSTAAHPGYARTNLQTSGPGKGMMGLLFAAAGKTLGALLSQDAAHGALPTLFAATAPEARPGGYYGPDGLSEMKGYPAPAPLPPAAQSEGDARRLWEESETLTGVRFGPF
ncbi:MAG: oxidoreductase [Verrucomicrobium sp.]|nr:oxidoreductase [Verrucomicrobium sp.]